MDGICRKRISLILFCSCKLALVSHTICFLVSCMLDLIPRIQDTSHAIYFLLSVINYIFYLIYILLIVV